MMRPGTNLIMTFSCRSVHAEKLRAAFRSIASSSLRDQSLKRLANLYGRGENELSRLEAIYNQAAILNRNMDDSKKEAYYVDLDLVNSAKQRLNALFRSADQELEQLNKVAERSTGRDTTTDYD